MFLHVHGFLDWQPPHVPPLISPHPRLTTYPPTHAQNVHDGLIKGLRDANLRKVSLKGPDVLQTTRVQYVLMLVLNGLQFLEFTAPLRPLPLSP